MKQHTFSAGRQRGFTFVELSFIIIVMGMIAMLVAQVVPAMRRSSATAETVRNLGNVELSLLSFAAINGRLPCADTDSDGLENGSGNTCAVIGKLPYRTLGYSSPLVNADGFDFKYAIYVNAGIALRDKAALGSAVERYRPSVGTGATVTLTDKSYTLTAPNYRLDFCQGLRAGMDAGFTANYLHVKTPGGSLKNVAYVLVDPGVGNMDLLGDMFDGYNSTAIAGAPLFEHPNRQQSMTYDDRVIVGYFDQMWESLGCSANMATAGRALPNIETTLALIKQSSDDYSTQMDIAVDMAFADNFSAGAGIALATTGLLSSGASIATDIASAINTLGVTAGASVAAGIAVGLNAAALAVAIVNQVYTVQNYNDFKDYRDKFDQLKLQKLTPLNTSVQSDVAAGLTNVYSDQ